MQSVSYLAALRRRWPLVAVLAVLGLALGFLFAPSTAVPANASQLDVRHGGFIAHAVVGISAGRSGASTTKTGTSGSPARGALFYAGAQTVAANTGDALHLDVDPATVRGAFSFTPSAGSSSLTIGARARTPELAVLLVNTFTTQETTYLNGVAASRQAAIVARDLQQVRRLRAQASNLANRANRLRTENGTIAALTLSELQQQRVAIRAAYLTAYKTYATAKSTQPPSNFFVVLQPASVATTTPIKVSALKHRKNLMILGLVFGLALGVLLALALAQIDRRLRGRRQTEDAFGAPVLLEVPVQRLRGTPADIVVLNDPDSPVAEAYRQLRTMLVFSSETLPNPVGRHPGDVVVDGGSFGEPDLVMSASADAPALRVSQPPSRLARYVAHRKPGGGHVVVISSPSDERSRPSTATNLAVAFAELNFSVLLVRTDLPPESATAGTLSPARAGDLSSYLQPTAVPTLHTLNLPYLDSFLRGSITEIVAEASTYASVLIVDAAPVLESHDVGALSSLADDVLIVAEYGYTTHEKAERTAEMLARMGVTPRGVIVTQVPGPKPRGPGRPAKPATAITNNASTPATSYASVRLTTPIATDDDDSESIVPFEAAEPAEAVDPMTPAEDADTDVADVEDTAEATEDTEQIDDTEHAEDTEDADDTDDVADPADTDDIGDADESGPSTSPRWATTADAPSND